ncbi:hypothetical protein ES703_107591 [subsurface metagenome]
MAEKTPWEKLSAAEASLAELKAEVASLKQLLTDSTKSLQSLRSELSKLSQSQEHKLPRHSHSEYLTKESWNKNIAALLKRVERLERGGN